jgi:hypothetical protein
MGLDLTGLGSVFDFGSKVIDKIFPDKDAADKAKLEMLRLQQEGQFKELEMVFENAKSQIGVNVEEAKSSSLFVSGWRPAVGWVCVFALSYNYVLMPLATWSAKFWYPDMQMVALETGELMTLLLGMLGLGGLRTAEKIKGVAAK